MDVLLPGLLVLQVLSLGAGFPQGAPSSSCEDMRPRHTGAEPAPGPAPYAILTNAKTFQAGQPLTVTITGPDYRGVLLEARTAASTNALGSWQSPPPDTKLLQCAGNPRGAVTHANANLKSNNTTYSWIPPSTVSSIYFRVTVAQQRTVFWLNVRSATLTKGAAEGAVLAAGGRLLLLAPGLLVFQGLLK